MAQCGLANLRRPAAVLLVKRTQQLDRVAATNDPNKSDSVKIPANQLAICIAA
jgi:hypothetical protein